MRKLVGAGACLVLASGIGLGAASSALAGAEPASIAYTVRKSVEPDPDVRSGTLPNGMRYYVQHAALPANGISMRLGFDIGSIEEQDNERGFAHFIEHLAFRQTRSAPGDDIATRFARRGVAFGRDQNARTTEYATTYRLDFNRADASGIDEGIRWLRDVADGILLSDHVIASEHGVVIAEQVAGAGEDLRVNESITHFQAPELRSTVRRPNGLKRSLDGINAAALRAFYERWYRPENASLVIVGDRPVEDLERLALANFGSWQGKGPKPQRAPLGRVDQKRGLDAMTLVSPSFPKAVSACRLRDAPSPKGDEMAQTVRDVRRSIWQGIVNDRLKRLVEEGDNGLLGAGVIDNSNDEFSATCILSMPNGEDWQKALALAQIELLRFGRDGPTEQELEAQVEVQRSLLRGAISNAKARTAPSIADMILERAIGRRTIVSPREAMHAFNVAVEDIDQAAVKAAFKDDWTGSGPLLALVMPASSDAAALRGAWERTEKLPDIPAYADAAKVAWPYADFGQPGKVVRTEQVDRPGFTRFHYANGVILNFKQLTSEPGVVDLRIRFGGGRRQLSNDDLVAATFGSGMMISGGLGRLPLADVERNFRNVSWEFEFDVGNDFFAFSHSSVTGNLPAMLQIMTAYLTDPGFRSDADARIPAAVNMVYRKFATDPGAAVAQAISEAMDPNDPARLPPEEQLASLKSSEFARVLKGALTGEAVEVTIAGDVDEQRAVSLVGRTLGALPARKYVDRRRSDTRFMRVPDTAIPLVKAYHEGPQDQAAAGLVWPLYVATPDRRKEEYALQLVAAVFHERLWQKVRSELGKVYDPRVTTQMPDYADQGLLLVEVAGEPVDIDQLIAEAKGIAGELAAGKITAEEVEAVREPKLSSFAARLDKNSWWASAMSGSARDPAHVDELLLYQSIMTSVTLEDVKAAAAKWLAGTPIVGTALPKPAALATSASAPDQKIDGNNRRNNR